MLVCCISASKHYLHKLEAVFGVHLAGEGDSTPETAAAEQAVKRARQGGAESASEAVFAALEAAEAQHSRQQQGKHVSSCTVLHLEEDEQLPAHCCAALCCAALCCVSRQRNNKLTRQMSIAFISPTLICLCMYFMICIYLFLCSPLLPSSLTYDKPGSFIVVIHHSEAGMPASR